MRQLVQNGDFVMFWCLQNVVSNTNDHRYKCKIWHCTITFVIQTKQPRMNEYRNDSINVHCYIHWLSLKFETMEINRCLLQWFVVDRYCNVKLLYYVHEIIVSVRCYNYQNRISMVTMNYYILWKFNWIIKIKGWKLRNNMYFLTNYFMSHYLAFFLVLGHNQRTTH